MISARLKGAVVTARTKRLTHIDTIAFTTSSQLKRFQQRIKSFDCEY